MWYTPLQNRKLRCLSTSRVQLAIAEVMGNASSFNSDSFAVLNKRNMPLYASELSNVRPGTKDDGRIICADNSSGEMIAGGLIDGGTPDVNPMTSMLTQYLASAFQMHTIFPSQLRMLRDAVKSEGGLMGQQKSHDAAIVELLTARMQFSRAMDRGDVWRGNETFASLVTDTDMQQYAMSADALCRAVYDERPTSHTRHRHGHSSHGGEEAHSLCSHSIGQRDGCCATWFTATAAPVGLQLRRQRAMLLRSMAAAGDRACQRLNALRRVEAQLEKLCQDEMCSLDVMVSTLGNCRAFGLARHALHEYANPGQAQLARATLSKGGARIVPLGQDHTPDRPEEMARISRAGGHTTNGTPLRPSRHAMRNDATPNTKKDHPKSTAVTPARLSVDDCSGPPVMNHSSGGAVSRCFGAWSMKSNPCVPPTAQKIIAVPTCMSWEMLPGDVLVLSNHALYDTRDACSPTSIDALAQLIDHELQRNQGCAHIASTLCDFALRFGAPHGLQVLVAMAMRAPSDATPDTHPSIDDGSSSAVPSSDSVNRHITGSAKRYCNSSGVHEGDALTIIEPGALYLEVWRRSDDRRQLRAFVKDCERCGVSVAQMLRLRWERVRDALSHRYALPYAELYGNECSMLQQIMDEESELFDDALLAQLADVADLTTLDESVRLMLDALFTKKAKNIESMLSR